jgi:hypothetical protein
MTAKKSSNTKAIAPSKSKTAATSSKMSRPATRKLKPAPRRAFRFRRQVSTPKPIRSVWKLTRDVSQVLWQHKRLFIGLGLTYGILNLILVRGFSGGTDVSQLKHQLTQVFSGNFGELKSSLLVFVSLASTSGNTSSSTGSAYQLFLMLIVSLATIWALRVTLAGEIVRLRDAFYRGMYPLIPFLLVLLVVGLQLIPFITGTAVYNFAMSSGIASDVGQQAAWVMLLLLLASVSLYMLCSSLFALYIVTLPNMTPLKALRSARELVRYRRWPIIRKLLFLPVMLLLVAVIIMLPVILFVPLAAQWLFFLLTMFGLVVTHAYMYTLYRELLA